VRDRARACARAICSLRSGFVLGESLHISQCSDSVRCIEHVYTGSAPRPLASCMPAPPRRTRTPRPRRFEHLHLFCVCVVWFGVARSCCVASEYFLRANLFAVLCLSLLFRLFVFVWSGQPSNRFGLLPHSLGLSQSLRCLLTLTFFGFLAQCSFGVASGMVCASCACVCSHAVACCVWSACRLTFNPACSRDLHAVCSTYRPETRSVPCAAFRRSWPICAWSTPRPPPPPRQR
jgi:hypothetical protein